MSSHIWELKEPSLNCVSATPTPLTDLGMRGHMCVGTCMHSSCPASSPGPKESCGGMRVSAHHCPQTCVPRVRWGLHGGGSGLQTVGGEAGRGSISPLALPSRNWGPGEHGVAGRYSGLQPKPGTQGVWGKLGVQQLPSLGPHPLLLSSPLLAPASSTPSPSPPP